MTTFGDVELSILRQLTPAEKVRVMDLLWRQAWALKAAGVRLEHADWSREQVEAEVREIFRRGGA